MKNLILILLVFGLSYSCFSNNENLSINYNLIDNPSITPTFICKDNTVNGDLIIKSIVDEKSDVLKECEVRLDMKLEDGTTIVGTVTFSDVSWWDCSKMQLAAWWGRNF
ncbi:hypothetical protein [Flavobacterium sp.]|uniref:hypothetical protein n=1 Tax=Flavobacterium sp. TaxID=239 RepID=UPI002608729A|nr:hypothetical protein [Flavobacterium sp.]MDD3004387.1 hypothetical protein [Flavobacterium sp.]